MYSLYTLKPLLVRMCCMKLLDHQGKFIPRDKKSNKQSNKRGFTVFYRPCNTRTIGTELLFENHVNLTTTT